MNQIQLLGTSHKNPWEWIADITKWEKFRDKNIEYDFLKKTTLDKINNKVDNTVEQISEMEDRVVEI